MSDLYKYRNIAMANHRETEFLGMFCGKGKTCAVALRVERKEGREQCGFMKPGINMSTFQDQLH